MCDDPIHVNGAAVPCGRCPPCKKRRVDEWGFRLLQEYKRHDHAHFITLTYDTDHVPISPNGFMTLDKKAFPLFMKRLRKMTSETLKYYAVGEYGSTRKRPHYHAILFGLSDPEMIFKVWTLGTAYLGTVTSASITYCMKYIDKMSYKVSHGRDDRVPEFPLMSKALGDNYLTPAMIRYHQEDPTRMYVTKPGGYKVSLPRYYRKKLFDEEDLAYQASVSREAASKQLAKHLHDFEMTFGHYENYTFPEYMESMKKQRRYEFYNQQKGKRKDL